jgi:hypothetical protein
MPRAPVPFLNSGDRSSLSNFDGWISYWIVIMLVSYTITNSSHPYFTNISDVMLLSGEDDATSLAVHRLSLSLRLVRGNPIEPQIDAGRPNWGTKFMRCPRTSLK